MNLDCKNNDEELSKLETNLNQTIIVEKAFTKEDISPTSAKEQWGFILSWCASGPFKILDGSAAAVILQQLSSQAAVQSHSLTSCDPSVGNARCYLNIGGTLVDLASFSLAVTALSNFAQMIVLLILSPLIDFGKGKRLALLVFTLIGALACFSYFLSYSPQLYWFAAISVIISELCFTGYISYILAYLPIMARYSPINANTNCQSTKDKHIDDYTNKLLSRGTTASLLSGTVICLTCATISYYMKGSILSLQIGMGICGFVWLTIGTIALIFLKNRGGPPIMPIRERVPYAFHTVRDTFKCAKKHSQLFILLVGYMFISDGINGLLNIPLLIASTDLNMENDYIFFIVAIGPILQLLGLQLSQFIKRKTRISTKALLLIQMIIILLLNVYSIIGNFTDKLGLHSYLEIYIYCGIYNLLFGSISTLYLVLYSQTVPKGMESKFFGLGQIFGGGGGWFTPFGSAILSGITGRIRDSLWIGFVLVFLSIVLTLLVDMDKGRVQSNQIRK